MFFGGRKLDLLAWNARGPVVQLWTSHGSGISNLLFLLTPRWRGRERTEDRLWPDSLKSWGQDRLNLHLGGVSSAVLSRPGGEVSQQNLTLQHLQRGCFSWHHSQPFAFFSSRYFYLESWVPGRAHHQTGGSWEAIGRERGILQLCLLLSAWFQGHSALRVAEDPGWGGSPPPSSTRGTGVEVSLHPATSP